MKVYLIYTHKDIKKIIYYLKSIAYDFYRG